MDVEGNPKYRRIFEDVTAGRYYESFQHVMSVTKRSVPLPPPATMRRAVVGKRYNEAFALLHHVAVVYIGAGEYSQALELMNEYISIAKKADVPFTADNIGHVISFFRAITAGIATMGDSAAGPLSKSEILERTEAIVDDALERNPSVELNLCVGQYFMAERRLSDAQKFVASAQDPDLLFKVADEWAAAVEEHEKPFVFLRCVLIQLATGRFDDAKCILLMLNQDFEDADLVPLPLQLAYIFTELCDSPDYQLYKLACKVYKPIIDADINFPRLIHHFRQLLFPGNIDPTDPYQVDPTAPQTPTNPFAALMRPFMQPRQ
ncbi:uncharacterized protein BcabD6B2_46160 [Babesia caballi]|uniref:Coatomer subunit epsilon n=1 Tax=Babesia caballi TaxID=5871 RepID=A0AAV4LZB9_BABCB|nr:hypothetical protein, conserved [Babesia caballi]